MVTVSLWGLLQSLLWLKGLSGFFFKHNGREKKLLLKWICVLAISPPASLPLHLLVFLFFPTVCSFNTPPQHVFLKPSEPECLIEVFQVCGRGWEEATLNRSFCYLLLGTMRLTCKPKRAHLPLVYCISTKVYSQDFGKQQNVLNGHNCERTSVDRSKTSKQRQVKST